MGFGSIVHSSDTEQSAITILIIITGPICIAATILRLIATKRGRRRIGWEDGLAVLALIAFLAYASICIAGFITANGRESEDLSLHDAVKTSKLAYAASSFFEINQFFAKASIFVLYYRIFSINRKFVICAAVLGIIQTCWFIAFFFCLIFLCVPVSKWWDALGTEKGWCMNDAALLASEETINSCVDFAMVGLSTYIVQKLSMRKSTKLKLAFIFVLGGLSGVIGFVKIGEVYGIPDQDGKANVSNGFWDLLQMATSIVCCCAPIYKTILPKPGLWSRIKSYFTTYGSMSLLRKNAFNRKANQSTHGGSHVTKTRPWLTLNLGSKSGFTWTEVRSEGSQSIPETSESPYSMKSVQIHQDVEMV